MFGREAGVFGWKFPPLLPPVNETLSVHAFAITVLCLWTFTWSCDKHRASKLSTLAYSPHRNPHLLVWVEVVQLKGCLICPAGVSNQGIGIAHFIHVCGIVNVAVSFRCSPWHCYWEWSSNNGEVGNWVGSTTSFICVTCMRTACNQQIHKHSKQKCKLLQRAFFFLLPGRIRKVQWESDLRCIMIRDYTDIYIYMLCPDLKLLPSFKVG